jgi:hypothetical protein
MSFAIAASDSSLSSGCISMNPMPLADQSVLRKTGFDESNRASTGELVNASFIESNKATRVSVHSMEGIALREYR